MTYLEQLQADHSVLQAMLEQRRTALDETMRPSVRLLYQAYLLILEDALGILGSLIEFSTQAME